MDEISVDPDQPASSEPTLLFKESIEFLEKVMSTVCLLLIRLNKLIFLLYVMFL